MCCFMSLMEKGEEKFFAYFNLFISKHMSPKEKKKRADKSAIFQLRSYSAFSAPLKTSVASSGAERRVILGVSGSMRSVIKLETIDVI